MDERIKKGATQMNFEESLSDLETKLVAADATLKAAAAAIKRAKGNAQVGQIRDLNKSLSELRQLSERFVAEIASADASWTFDAESYLSSGKYLAELQDIAKSQGLTLVEKDGKIYCFPMLLTLSAKEAVVQIDRKPERKIRPRELIKLLLSRQNQPRKSSESKFLETLFEAYCYLGPKYQPDWSRDAAGVAPAVPFLELYQLLTLLPGSDRNYPKEEFVRDIHLLSSQPGLRTKDGRRFSITSSTGSKTTNQRLTVFDEQGRESIYVGIRFQKD